MQCGHQGRGVINSGCDPDKCFGGSHGPKEVIPRVTSVALSFNVFISKETHASCKYLIETIFLDLSV